MRYKDLFVRLVGKHGVKMKAVTAVQRKLLELTYILHKNNTTYNKLTREQCESVENKREQLLVIAPF